MKKGFSLVELIISIGLISVISFLLIFSFTGIKETYADPYESLRQIISDATEVYLNISSGEQHFNELNLNKQIKLSGEILIKEGLLEETYYVKNSNENIDIKNVVIIVNVTEEGFLNYNIEI